MKNKRNKKGALEQSIEKTIIILSKSDINNMPEFEKYQGILNSYVEEYKVEIGYTSCINNSSLEVEDGE